MRLICTDPSHRDLCALGSCTLEMAFGDSENSFELRMPIDAVPQGLTFGSLVYAEETAYGGIVDDVGSDTTGKAPRAVFAGRTWHGVLDRKVLRPDAGEDYLSISGEANAVLRQLICRLGLSGLFAASAADSGMRLSYRFARYVAGYAGIRAMLASQGAKLSVRWDGDKAVLAAEPVRDWSDEELEAGRTPIEICLRSRPVNHLVCLGKGELAARKVIDLYADEAGHVSKTQSLVGLDEVAEVYDYSSAEPGELEEDGIERLRGYQAASTCDVPELPDGYDVGDIVGGRESRLGVFVTATITKKIVTVGRYGAVCSCEAGSPRMRRVTSAL